MKVRTLLRAVVPLFRSARLSPSCSKKATALLQTAHFSSSARMQQSRKLPLVAGKPATGELSNPTRAKAGNMQVAISFERIDNSQNTEQLLETLKSLMKQTPAILTRVHFGKAMTKCRKWRDLRVGMHILGLAESCQMVDNIMCGNLLAFVHRAAAIDGILAYMDRNALDWRSDEVIVSSLIKCCSFQTDQSARAYAFWKLLVDHCATQKPPRKPSLMSFTNVLSVCAKSHDLNTAKAVWKQLVSDKPIRFRTDIKIDTDDFDPANYCTSQISADSHVFDSKVSESRLSQSSASATPPFEVQQLLAFMKVAILCDDLKLVKQLEALRMRHGMESARVRVSLLAPFWARKGHFNACVRVIREALAADSSQHSVAFYRNILLTCVFNKMLRFCPPRSLRTAASTLEPRVESRLSKSSDSGIAVDPKNGAMDAALLMELKRKRLKLWQKCSGFIEAAFGESLDFSDNHTTCVIVCCIIAVQCDDWLQCLEALNGSNLLSDKCKRLAVDAWAVDKGKALLDLHMFAHEESVLAMRSTFAFDRDAVAKAIEESSDGTLRIICGKGIHNRSANPLSKTIVSEMASWKPAIACRFEATNKGVLICSAKDVRHFLKTAESYDFCERHLQLCHSLTK